jgi:pyridoxal phosphate enzyme (YggS family)
VLIEVNLGHESTKSGTDEGKVAEIAEAVDRSEHLRLLGLMTIPPFSEDVEEVRPYFRRLRELLQKLNEQRPAGRKLRDLSMGMSHDFEIAIEEGATMVRIGTAIFGSRPAPAPLKRDR